MANKQRIRTQDLCMIGVSAAVVAVMAQIIIPMPLGVPLTMQTFAVCLCGMLLGPRRGAVALLVYLFLGAVGIPVFSGFMGGIHRLVGPTGGFLLTYPLMAWLVGRGAEKQTRFDTVVGMALAMGVNYVGGSLMYAAIGGVGFGRAFAACVLPFIPTDILKAVLAGVLGAKIRARIAVSIY